MKVQKLKTYGWEAAFRGMRNPLESWHKSDSHYEIFGTDDSHYIDDVMYNWVVNELGGESYLDKYDTDPKYVLDLEDKYFDWLIDRGLLTDDPSSEAQEGFWIGPNDLSLAQRLIKSGPEHCKFMRQIFISADITAPLYWWKQFDTYKIGTTANSTSTMHKLASNPITKECFETLDYDPFLPLIDDVNLGLRIDSFIDDLEQLRQKYLETKDKRYWKELVRWLPNGWLQTRTVTMSYANFRNIYFQRKNHKLTEWHRFCGIINLLPYGMELIAPEELQLDN